MVARAQLVCAHLVCAHLVSVNVVHELRRGPTRMTAIDKRPTDGRVEVGPLGVDGDVQCDKRFHGGPDRALYAFAGEESDWWAKELDRGIPPGYFGENLTTRGLDVDGALIGERWQIGDIEAGIVVEVRLPRDPCGNLSGWVGIPRFHRTFHQHGRPGAYLAVLRPGVIRAGDPITVVHRPDHDVTVSDCSQGRVRDPASLLTRAGS